VDKLEELLGQGWRVPIVNKALIDEDEFLRLIDQMRISMPQEIKQAQQIQQDREQIIAQAQERAEHIVTLAKDQADRLVGEHELLKRAQTEREAILDQAQKEAEEAKAQADNYALDVLEDLQHKLESFQITVRNGIELLNRRLVEPEVPAPAEDASTESPAPQS
jgi:vacuolar-type H+-ATPase subunit H